MEDSARALADRTAGSLSGVSAACEERNLSTIPEQVFLGFVSAFREELQRRGVKIVKSGNGAKITLTMSENLDGYLGIVRIQRGENAEVILEPLAGSVKPAREQSAPAMGLHKELMLSQEEPLLDADIYRYLPNNLDVLEQRQKATYEWKGSAWERVYLGLLPRKLAASRDLRGVVWHSVDASGGQYPGEACSNGMQGLRCEPSTRPLRPTSVDRELVDNRKLAPWFSAAQFEMNGHDALLITGEDGVARVYSEGPDAIATIPAWGSEIASIHSGCGSGWQILATGTKDWASPDSLAAFEIEGEKVTKVSDSVDLPGPVISLHETASDKIPGRDMAIAVVRNLQTGLYEVYRLTITCPD